MKIQAVISQTPRKKFQGRPELVYSVEVTSCLQVIKSLRDLAEMVNIDSDRFCDTAKAMAYYIQLIEAVVKQQLGDLK